MKNETVVPQAFEGYSEAVGRFDPDGADIQLDDQEESEK